MAEIIDNCPDWKSVVGHVAVSPLDESSWRRRESNPRSQLMRLGWNRSSLRRDELPGRGIEPRLPEYETGVVPLDQPGILSQVEESNLDCLVTKQASYHLTNLANYIIHQRGLTPSCR